MWVSLAGPMSNFLMAIIGAIFFRVGLVSVYDIGLVPGSTLPTLALFVYIFITTNLWLMLFNLLPLSPLDGEKVLDYFLPPAAARVLEDIRPYGPMILMVILFVLPMVGIDVIGKVIQPAFTTLTRLLIGV
jgi:Zn-dependent protease